MDVSDLALELKSRENMDDSDLALERAVQLLDRESESSDIEVDSQADCSVYSEGVVNSLDLYTPSMANPAYGVCRRGSLLNSGSEDSASMSSFCTDSDAGPARSAVYCRQSRGLASGRPARCAVSDSETRPRKLGRHSGASLTMDIRVPVEDFALRIRERLLAVSKDRETMTQKVRDLARQKGHNYDEIMAVEWYELPEACKYLDTRNSTTPVQEPRDESSCNDDIAPSSPRLTISRSELTPRSIVSLSSMGISKMLSGNRISEVEEGMRGLQVNQVNRKRSHRNISGSNSVLSATSDSGVGDNWATSGLTTPSNDRLRAYLHGQNMLSTSLQPREREAQAAAIALISNSPQPDSLNPVPLHMGRQQQQQQQQQHRHRGGGGGHGHEVEPRHHPSRQQRLPCHYSSGDDSSSVFTMTSQSSTSDLFIPRKIHQHIYTDSEDQHHFANNRYRRMLSTPKRSNHIKHGHPSPLSEQHRQQLTQHRPPIQPPQSPRPSDMMLSPPPPPQHPISHTSGAGGGTVHVIYHLDDIPTPYYAKWNNGIAITLSVFKERVFARKGDYRFFFESFNPDLNMSLLEEFTEEDDCLPVVRGKIIGRVEKAQ